MFGHGTGSEMRHPLGYSMVGGLALSQVLTLYTTPVVYLYLSRLQAWLQGRKSTRLSSSGAKSPPPRRSKYRDQTSCGEHGELAEGPMRNGRQAAGVRTPLTR
jgi:AcrB/AcrD/AcrF family